MVKIFLRKRLGIFHLGAINVQIMPMYSMEKYIQLFLGVIAQLLIVSSITSLFIPFNTSLTIILLSGKNAGRQCLNSNRKMDS